MPLRSELDPSELKPVLPSLIIIDVQRAAGAAAPTFACRLAGTAIDDRFGLRLTGLKLQDAPFGEVRPLIQAQYETCVRERRPIQCSHEMVVNESRYIEYDRLVVPLADAEGQVSMLVAAIDFHCAYPVQQGRPIDCPHPTFCERLDLCIARGRPK